MHYEQHRFSHHPQGDVAASGVDLWSGASLSRAWPSAVSCFLAGGASAHPTPRRGITGDEVVPHEPFRGHSRIQSVHRQAREIPGVLDELHCYCECASHSGHYSLLNCFKSDRGADCDVCLTSAATAHRMTMEGKSLDEIREAIDDYRGR